MIFKSKNGRTYRLAKSSEWKTACQACLFFNMDGTGECPRTKTELLICCTIKRRGNFIWKETIFSRVWNWRRK